MRLAWYLVGIVVLGAAGWFVFHDRAPVIETGRVSAVPPFGNGSAAPKHEETPGPDIIITRPGAGDVISSPLTVEGRARAWYFEGSFPVLVTDAAGRRVGGAPVRAQGNWMTNEFVPFAGTVSFDAGQATSGFVVFHNDNESGLPEHDKQVSISVKFLPTNSPSSSPGVSSGCRATGCSGQICSEHAVVTTCEYSEVYACYRTARCARQADGQCGWTINTALAECLRNAAHNPPQLE